MSGARIGELERGDGATAPLEVWVRLGDAINRPLAVAFSQEPESREPDNNLLAARGLLLDLARQHGRQTDLDLPTRPPGPEGQIDIVLQDVAARALIVIQVWNRLDDLEAALDTASQTVAEASETAALAAGGDPPSRVAMCWLLFDGPAHRRLVSLSAEILASRFPGSSVRWVRCLGDGAPPPTEPGLAWIDPGGRRIVPLRRRRQT